MTGRLLLFAAWALLGAVVSYAALYALSSFGLVILAACLFAGLALPRAGGSRWPEGLGLLAGPGVFLLVAASAGGGPLMAAIGAAIIFVTATGYVIAGRVKPLH